MLIEFFEILFVVLSCLIRELCEIVGLNFLIKTFILACFQLIKMRVISFILNVTQR